MSQQHLFGEPVVTERFSWAPLAVGTRVRLRFGADKRRAHEALGQMLGQPWALHLAEGTVRIAPAERARPRNYLVELDDGRRLVVPHGQLRALVTAAEPEPPRDKSEPVGRKDDDEEVIEIGAGWPGLSPADIRRIRLETSERERQWRESQQGASDRDGDDTV